MNSALVIVHADEPFLNSDLIDLYLKDLLCQHVKRVIDEKDIYYNETYDETTTKKGIPEYLSQFKRIISIPEGGKSVYTQYLKCKNYLIEKNYSDVELCGLRYNHCIQEFYNIFIDLRLNLSKHFISESHFIEWLLFITDLNENQVEKIANEKINTKINGELTDFVIKNYYLPDELFIKEAEEYHLSNITLKSKEDFIKYYNKNIKPHKSIIPSFSNEDIGKLNKAIQLTTDKWIL